MQLCLSNFKLVGNWGAAFRRFTQDKAAPYKTKKNRSKDRPLQQRQSKPGALLIFVEPRHYFFRRSRTAAVMAVTPVRMVG